MARPFRSWVDIIVEEALRDPDRAVVRTADREVTGAALAQGIHRYAWALAARGIGPRDRVALLADRSPEALMVRYAVALTGAASVFCPDTGVPERLATFLRHVDPTLLVVFPSTAADAAAAEAVAAVTTAVAVGTTTGLPDLEGEAAAGSHETFTSRARPDDLAVLIASGGTTGTSKASMRSFAAYSDMLGYASMAQRRLLVASAFAYVSQVLIAQALVGGGTVTLVERFDPALMLRLVTDHRITHLGLVEPQLVELVEQSDLLDADLSSLTRITHIGAPAPASLRRRLLRAVGPILANTYGMSEAGLVSALVPPDYDLGNDALLSSSGRPLPGVSVVVRRPDGSRAEIGETGEIVVRVPGMATGYRGRPDDPRFRDGWFVTGDLGLLDAAGYLHVRGRAADVRYIGDRAVMPIDLEDAACAHPAVLYAVALPLDTTSAGFGLVARRARGSGLTAPELTAFLQERATGAVPPSRVIVVDQLPLTEQGKPDRLALAALLAP